MAENESLDLGGAYAKRWDIPFESVRKGDSCKDVAKKIEKALYTGVRKSLKQWEEYGTSLAELLRLRASPQAMRGLIRKTHGHHYAQMFAAAVAISGPSEAECLRGWLDAILDKVSDQICLRVAGKENWPTFYDIQEFMDTVRKTLEPVVERIATKFQHDPAWKPRQAAPKERASTNPTADLLGMSLLKRSQP